MMVNAISFSGWQNSAGNKEYSGTRKSSDFNNAGGFVLEALINGTDQLVVHEYWRQSSLSRSRNKNGFTHFLEILKTPKQFEKLRETLLKAKNGKHQNNYAPTHRVTLLNRTTYELSDPKSGSDIPFEHGDLNAVLPKSGRLLEKVA